MANSQNPFEEFTTATPIAEPAVPREASDPFAEFRATAPATTASPEPANPFAEFTEQQPDEYGKLRREMDRGIVESITESPAFVAKPISPQDIQTIAQKHGVPAATLEEWAPYLGASSTETGGGYYPKRVAGMAGQAVAFGIPQKLAKMTQTPEMERALDDLQELARARSSLLESTATAVVGPGSVVGAAGKGIGRKVAAGALTGAVAGFGASREGQELPSAAVGAGIGGLISGAASKLAERGAVRRAAGEAGTTLEERSAQRIIDRGGADLRNDVEGRIAAHNDADSILAERTFRDQPLTPQESNTIARAYHPDVLERLADPSSEESRLLDSRIQRRLQGPALPGEKKLIVTPEQRMMIGERELAENVLNTTRRELAAEVMPHQIHGGTTSELVDTLRRWAGEGAESGQGLQYGQGRVRDYLSRNHALQVIGNRGLVDTGGAGLGARAADILSDAQQVLRSYDEKWRGLGLEDAHKQIVRGVNLMSFPREDMRGELRNIFVQNRRNGLNREALRAGDLIRNVESGKPLTEQQERIFAPFRDFFARAINTVNEKAVELGLPPLALKERPNYVPSMLRDPGELSEITSQRMQSLLSDAERVTGRTHTDLASVPEPVLNSILAQNPEHNETIRFIRSLSGTSSERPADLARAFRETFQSRVGREKMSTMARAALAREDAIPHWARETNLYKLADRWATNTLRHIYLREGIDSLRSKLVQLEKLGDTNAAKYVRNLLQDLQGTRKGTVAEFGNLLSQKFLRHMDARIRRTPENSMQRGVLEGIRALPATLNSLNRNVYGNLLGAANPRTLIMNATQPLTKTLPELGPVYGPALFMRGAMRIGGIRKLPEYIHKMEQVGLAPAKYNPGNLEYLSEGFMRTNLAQKPAAVLRGIEKVGMKPYEFMETANRGITYAAADMMAHDLIPEAGQSISRVAQGALERFPESVRAAAGKAIAAGDRDELTRVLGTHLINNTQFQYNRASMSEFGRTMGPLFSTFSKWPTATFGQAMEAVRTKGLPAASVKLTQELGAPLALLELGDYMMGQYSDEGLSDRQKKLFSASGLSQAAPVGNLKGIYTGDFFTPPAVDTVLRTFVSPVKEGSFERTKDALASSIYMFSPGGLGGWVRFLTDDLVTLYSGERPEGTNFLERTEEGARRLGL